MVNCHIRQRRRTRKATWRLHVVLGLLPALCGALDACRSSGARLSTARLGGSDDSTGAAVMLDRIRRVTESLTSPAMAGRGLGTAEGNAAAAHLARTFHSLGLQTAPGTADFLQRVPLWRIAYDTQRTIVHTRARALPARATSDEVSGPGPTDGDASGKLMYVGFGVVDSVSGHNDLEATDVRGKIVIVSTARRSIGAEERALSWSAAIGNAVTLSRIRNRGAAALILVDDAPALHTNSSALDLSFHNDIVADTLPAPLSMPVVHISTGVAEALFEHDTFGYAGALGAASRGDRVTHELSDSAHVMVRRTVTPVKASNVIAVLRGSDHLLSRNAVVFMAHYDGLGRDRDGKVRAGAADNALGIGMLVALAERVAAMRVRPRRTMLFLATTGEERGMLGAKFWVDNPSLPISQVSAVVNFDGIGTEIFGPIRRIVGFGAELSTLGEALAAIEQERGLISEPDPFGSRRPFLRSDHIILARRGVPALMLLGLPEGPVAESMQRALMWVERAYHAPADTIGNDWDWRGPRDLASVAFAVGIRIANAAEEPAWLSTSPFQRQRRP
jgi:hypothetical protein